MREEPGNIEDGVPFVLEQVKTVYIQWKEARISFHVPSSPVSVSYPENWLSICVIVSLLRKVLSLVRDTALIKEWRL